MWPVKLWKYQSDAFTDYKCKKVQCVHKVSIPTKLCSVCDLPTICRFITTICSGHYEAVECPCFDLTTFFSKELKQIKKIGDDLDKIMYMLTETDDRFVG